MGLSCCYSLCSLKHLVRMHGVIGWREVLGKQLGAPYLAWLLRGGKPGGGRKRGAFQMGDIRHGGIATSIWSLGPDRRR